MIETALGVGCFRRGKRDAVVAPKVSQFFASIRIDERTIAFIEFVNRQQFDCGHAEVLEIGNLLGEAGERSWSATPEFGWQVNPRTCNS